MDAQADFATQIKRIDHISAVFSMRECARVCKLGLYRAFSPTTNTIANGKHRLIEWPHRRDKRSKLLSESNVKLCYVITYI